MPNSVLNGSSAQIAGAYTGASGGWLTVNNNNIDPWSGGIINSKGITAYPANNYANTPAFISGTFLCVWGGGHASYLGNEIYCFGPLESASPQWWCPAPATNPPVSSGVDANGNPVSAHSYGAMVYLKGSNELLLTGLMYGGLTGSDGGWETPLFDFTNAAPATGNPWNSNTGNINGGGSGRALWITCYDSGNNGVWGWDFNGTSSYGLGFYNVATKTWSHSDYVWMIAGGGEGYAYWQMGMANDPKRGINAMFGNVTSATGHPTADQELWLYRTNNGLSNIPYRPTLTGAALPSSGSNSGSIVYDPILDCFVVYPGGPAGSLLYTVTAPPSNPYTGVWTVAAIAGSGAPVAENTNCAGTWGRFNVIPNPAIPGYVMVQGVTESVYVYRPS